MRTPGYGIGKRQAKVASSANQVLGGEQRATVRRNYPGTFGKFYTCITATACRGFLVAAVPYRVVTMPAKKSISISGGITSASSSSSGAWLP
jgi:hypothetical protein